MSYHQIPYNYITQSIAIGSGPLPTVPGGNNTEIQFNNNGAFDGTPNATYDGALLLLKNNDTTAYLAIGTPNGTPILGENLIIDNSSINGIVLQTSGNDDLFLSNGGNYTEAVRGVHTFTAFTPGGISDILIAGFGSFFQIYFNEASNQPYLLGGLVNSTVQGFHSGKIRLNTTDNDYSYPEIKIGLTDPNVLASSIYYLTEDGTTNSSLNIAESISQITSEFLFSSDLTTVPNIWVKMSIIHYGTNFLGVTIQYILDPII